MGIVRRLTLGASLATDTPESGTSFPGYSHNILNGRSPLPTIHWRLPKLSASNGKDPTENSFILGVTNIRDKIGSVLGKCLLFRFNQNSNNL